MAKPPKRRVEHVARIQVSDDDEELILDATLQQDVPTTLTTFSVGIVLALDRISGQSGERDGESDERDH